jgi:hypothetical protein
MSDFELEEQPEESTPEPPGSSAAQYLDTPQAVKTDQNKNLYLPSNLSQHVLVFGEPRAGKSFLGGEKIGNSNSALQSRSISFNLKQILSKSWKMLIDFHRRDRCTDN